MSDWDWELTDTARRDFESLDDHARDRIATKLDEIVTDEWREPPDHLEPLQERPTTNFGSDSSVSAVVLIEPRRSSMSCGFENVGATHTAVTTIDRSVALRTSVFSQPYLTTTSL